MRTEQPREAVFRRGEASGAATLVADWPVTMRTERPWPGKSSLPSATSAELIAPCEYFPPLPTLLATRLQLELLLADQPVDLRAAAGILMNDLGATLEIFRRAGEECGSSCDAPERLEDCLASLGTDVWMEVVCAGAVERTAVDEAGLAELTDFWEHGRSLAYACWSVAEQMEGICPEKAFFVGLLHEAARLPVLLGWAVATDANCDTRVLEPRSCSKEFATQLALHWRLPRYLWPVLARVSLPSRWRRLLELAHAWSRGKDCLLTHIAWPASGAPELLLNSSSSSAVCLGLPHASLTNPGYLG